MVSKYFTQIQKILTSSLIDIGRVKSTTDGIVINTDAKEKIRFRYTTKDHVSELMKERMRKENESGFGVISETLNSSIKRNLEATKISYITLDGDICIYFDTRVIKVSKSRTRNSNIENFLKSHLKGEFNSELVLPTPTDLISPYGLEILDVIFRLPNSELSSMTPYGLCKEFNLNHGRLFRMSNSMGTKDLVTFKQTVRKLPKSWWASAFTYPRTNQRLLAFQRNSESYASFTKDNSLETYQAIEETRSKYGIHSVILGPSELLKHLGYLINDDIQLWVVGDQALKNLKRLLRLTPDVLGNKGTKVFTSKIEDEKELARQCLVSRAPGFGELNSETRYINYFRAIWDACNGDSRLHSASMELLRERILK